MYVVPEYRYMYLVSAAYMYLASIAASRTHYWLAAAPAGAIGYDAAQVRARPPAAL